MAAELRRHWSHTQSNCAFYFKGDFSEPDGLSTSLCLKMSSGLCLQDDRIVFDLFLSKTTLWAIYFIYNIRVIESGINWVTLMTFSYMKAQIWNCMHQSHRHPVPEQYRFVHLSERLSDGEWKIWTMLEITVCLELLWAEQTSQMLLCQATYKEADNNPTGEREESAPNENDLQVFRKWFKSVRRQDISCSDTKREPFLRIVWAFMPSWRC